jgi:hypothetical protein
MGFRFHKSLSIIPGLRINLSKSGPSLSVGEHGMTENLSSRGAKTTVGLPGSGLSYTTTDRLKNGQNWIKLLIMAAVAFGITILTKK